MGGSAYRRETGGMAFGDSNDGCEGPQPSKPLWTNVDRFPGGRQSPGAADRGGLDRTAIPWKSCSSNWRCQMSKSAVRLVLVVFILSGLGTRSRAESFDPRNFAIDTYYPTPNEIHLAEQRARKYWARNASRFGPNPTYLAVETSKIFESEIVQDLWPKLINSNTTTSFFAKSPGRHHTEVDLKGIMIFDTRTGYATSNRGFVSVDTPNRGQVARFGDYVARYIGTGGGLFQ
jgi:hypothetical protein